MSPMIGLINLDLHNSAIFVQGIVFSKKKNLEWSLTTEMRTIGSFNSCGGTCITGLARVRTDNRLVFSTHASHASRSIVSFVANWSENVEFRICLGIVTIKPLWSFVIFCKQNMIFMQISIFPTMQHEFVLIHLVHHKWQPYFWKLHIERYNGAHWSVR